MQIIWEQFYSAGSYNVEVRLGPSKYPHPRLPSDGALFRVSAASSHWNDRCETFAGRSKSPKWYNLFIYCGHWGFHRWNTIEKATELACECAERFAAEEIGANQSAEATAARINALKRKLSI